MIASQMGVNINPVTGEILETTQKEEELQLAQNMTVQNELQDEVTADN